MIQIIFNRKNYKTYKDFYEDLYKQVDGAGFIDWEQYPNLNFNADFLDEFLWYCNTDGDHHYIFLNFDKEEIKLQKTYDDYEYNIVFEVFEDFVKQYPNNKLEFRNDDKK